MSIYLINKQSGITSNKTLSLFKKELNVTKAGFSGVLDPFATGLLIVATEGDTRFLDLFLNSPKTYTGTMLFGKTTDTLDIDGTVVEEIDNINIDEQSVKEIINNKFLGEIEQIPPKYSNIKVDGKRAHELSRNEVEFELKPVTREIYSFDIEEKSTNEYNFKVTVSSGTYIRSLARDIGRELSVPAMLTSLRRVSIGSINAPESTIEANREDIVPLTFISVEGHLLNDLLNGKEVNIDSKLDELVVKDDSRYIWIKKLESGMYKIHKNIK